MTPDNQRTPDHIVEALLQICGPEIALNCGAVRSEVQPILDRLIELEDKGFRKTAEDLLEERLLISQFYRRTKEVLGTIDIRGEIGGSVRTVVVNLSDFMGERGVTAGDIEPYSEGSATLTSHPLELVDIHTDNETFAEADAKLFFTPWSREFVHGSDCMIHVTKAAQLVCRPGERVIKLDKVTWRKPIKTNIKLVAYTGDFDEVVGEGAYCLDAEYKTSNGRTITVLGMQQEDDPVSVQMPRNPYAEDTVCNCGHCMTSDGDVFKFRLKNPPIAGCYEIFRADASISTATLIETLTLALVYAIPIAMDRRGDGNIQDLMGGRLSLMGGIRDLDLSVDLEEVYGCNGELEIEILAEKMKPGRSGMTLIPFKYKFPGQSDFSTGIAAQTGSASVINHCLR